MNYLVNTLTVGELRQRFRELEAAGRNVQPSKDEPEEHDEYFAWCDNWDEFEEFMQLETALVQCRHCDNSTTLVGEGFWVQYSQEGAYDRGEIERGSLAESFMDWEKYAETVRQDWQEVGPVAGVTFLVRS